MKFTPVASLTGKDGKTTQTGLIVVLKEDPAKSIDDLKEYKILFGCAEAEDLRRWIDHRGDPAS